MSVALTPLGPVVLEKHLHALGPSMNNLTLYVCPILPGIDRIPAAFTEWVLGLIRRR